MAEGQTGFFERIRQIPEMIRLSRVEAGVEAADKIKYPPPLKRTAFEG